MRIEDFKRDVQALCVWDAYRAANLPWPQFCEQYELVEDAVRGPFVRKKIVEPKAEELELEP